MTIKSKAFSKDATVLSGKTFAEGAYTFIRRDIISGKLSPGEKLQPGRLQKIYDVGIGPIREALTRLSSEGLVVAEVQRGFYVAGVSVEELNNIAQLRIILSVKALELSIAGGDDKWENRVITTHYHLSKADKTQKPLKADFLDNWERLNREFHSALESGCNSPWLIRFCAILYDQYERYRRRFIPLANVSSSIREEHQKLKELALGRDVRALEVLKAHIQHSSRLLEARMKDALLNRKKHG